MAIDQHNTAQTACTQSETLFENPFAIEDLSVFDDTTLRRILAKSSSGVTTEQLGQSLKDAPLTLVKRITQNLPRSQRKVFRQVLQLSLSADEVAHARKQVLNSLFWELTYWKTPELYEELTEGEELHPGIFQQLEPDLRGKVVLDVGAGSGRATFACLYAGARIVHAVEPSPGLLRILEQKREQLPAAEHIVLHEGCFDAIPLPDNSVDVALSCSAFIATPEQGGEPGLVELKRVTKASGKIVLIWPRLEDHDWLQGHGFHYVALPIQQEMQVHFRSLQNALECARHFYAHNKAVLKYILSKQTKHVPFSVIGINPPHDYFWLEVTK